MKKFQSIGFTEKNFQYIMKNRSKIEFLDQYQKFSKRVEEFYSNNFGNTYKQSFAVKMMDELVAIIGDDLPDFMAMEILIKNYSFEKDNGNEDGEDNDDNGNEDENENDDNSVPMGKSEE